MKWEIFFGMLAIIWVFGLLSGKIKSQKTSSRSSSRSRSKKTKVKCNACGGNGKQGGRYWYPEIGNCSECKGSGVKYI